MFLFKRRQEKDEFIAPMKGNVIDLNEVQDEAFSSKQMGEGFAIEYSGDIIYAPCDGEIVACFPSGHALGIKHKKQEILLHIGIDTVELKGEGFRLLVRQGQLVEQGDPLIEVSSDFIKEKGYDATSMMIFTSGESVSILKLHQEVQALEKGVIKLCGTN